MRIFAALWTALLVACAAGPAFAQPPAIVAKRPIETQAEHPLAPVLRLTRAELAYLDSTVQDYTCRIVKRERIDGELQEHQYMRAWVRPAKQEGGREVPLAVLLDFEAPRKIAGRRLLFIDGAFDGKMLVRQREGGITFRINTDGGMAARESTMPITNIGIHNMLREAITKVEDDIAADPAGRNTQVDWFQNAKIDNRPATAIRITHPRRYPDLEFHVAHVFIDQEMRLPVRLDFYDWPDAEGGEPVLLGEFTYQDVQLNVGLTDAHFDHARLGLHYE